MARSMLLVGMLAPLALSIAKRSQTFMLGSMPARAAIAMALPSFVNTAPRAASLAPFSRLIVDHLECPDMRCFLSLISVLSYLLVYHVSLAFCIGPGPATPPRSRTI